MYITPIPTPQDEGVLTNPLNGSNPLNEDPPDSTSDFVEALSDSVVSYVDSVMDYEEAVQAVIETNELGEQVTNTVCPKQRSFMNIDVASPIGIRNPYSVAMRFSCTLNEL